MALEVFGLSVALGWPRRRAPALSIWGDGLLEQSLASLWYPTCWEDVGDDELVFLIPSLAAQCSRPMRAPGGGPIPCLRRALSTRVFATVRILSESTGSSIANKPSQVLDTIARCGVLTAVDPLEAWAEGKAENWPRWTSGSRFGTSRHPGGNDAAEQWIFELSVLACLNELLETAIRGPDSQSPVHLADVLVASIHARFNAAYVYPQIVCMHELLAVGAWLGHLVRGRSALMPDFVADRLLGGPEDAPDDLSQTLLRFHADCAIGWDRVRRLAQKVKSTSHPLLIKPRDEATSSTGGPPIWNERLYRRIAESLNL